MSQVYLINSSISKFGKLNISNLDLSYKTAGECLNGFDRSKIDLLIFTSFAPESYTKEYHLAAKLADKLNLNKDVFAIRTDTASSSGASAFHTACYLLESGKFKNALIVGTEIMSSLDRGTNNILLGSVLSDTQRNLAMSMAQGAAMITNLYLKKFNYSREDLFFISEKLHSIGKNNPKAHIQKSITKEDYFNSPIFSSPLCLYDISPLSDGSASILLSSEIKSNLKIIGKGSGLSTFKSLELTTFFSSSRIAAKKAFSEADLKPDKIEIAEIHDAFTPFEIIGLEDTGIIQEGLALKYIKEGKTHPNSDLPVNASGGLKTRGHPIGASGLAQIVEINKLMKNKNKKYGLTLSIGGLATNNFVTILENSD
ncbi:MAG: thiolase family protein [Leptospiraceae bacterium]|nr:thiolase family protein [Leptospiraceae bacterium]